MPTHSFQFSLTDLGPTSFFAAGLNRSMEFSIVGSLICAALVLTGRLFGATIITALIASLAFGATAVVTIPALGGASPLIFAILAVIFLLSVVMRRSFRRDLGTILGKQPLAWLIILLAIYAICGAMFLPRIFFGQTTAFIPVKGVITELPLSPVSGNITQSLYFLLSCLCFFGTSIVLLERRNFIAIRNGFMAWAVLQVVMGFTDLAGKALGAGDVLAPIRTASYALLANVEEAGFWRIVGAYPEASTFGATTLCLLAFTFTYWRITQERSVLFLAGALLILLVFSTSSTAYVGGILVSVPLLISISKSALRDRLAKQDLVLLLMAAAGVLAAIAIYLVNEKAFESFWQLIDTVVLNKATTASGQERAYWNYQSLQSFYDTGGLGVGLGSSRASSWIVAVISQLGIFGALMIAALTWAIIRGSALYYRGDLDPEIRATVLSVRACALAALVSGSLISGAVDPGIVFFIALAAILNLSAAPGGWRLRAPSRVSSKFVVAD